MVKFFDDGFEFLNYCKPCKDLVCEIMIVIFVEG